VFKNFENGFMFLCNKATEDECMSGIFGATGQFFNDMKNISPKSALFLFRMAPSPQELPGTGGGILHGVFRATGQAGKNLKRDAFGGRFPAQVHVEPHYRFPYPVFNSDLTEILGDTNRCGPLTRDETVALLEAFAKNCVEDVTRMYLKRQIGLKEFVPITQTAYKWPESELDLIQKSCRAP